MSTEDIIEAFRLLAITYLLILAVAAAFGYHMKMLVYPAQIAYSTVRLLLLGVTLGRVQMAPLANKAKRSSTRKLRSVKDSLEERKNRDGEALESVEASTWASATEDTQVEIEDTAPEPAVPLFNPFQTTPEEQPLSPPAPPAAPQAPQGPPIPPTAPHRPPTAPQQAPQTPPSPPTAPQAPQMPSTPPDWSFLDEDEDEDDSQAPTFG